MNGVLLRRYYQMIVNKSEEWLYNSTEAQIIAAFGNDGVAVINATNAYLNQLAASGQAGKDKATALAGFINEDPMMVCSLGLQVEGVTMPIRWLYNGGEACILTDYKPNNNTEVVTKFKGLFANKRLCGTYNYDVDSQFDIILYDNNSYGIICRFGQSGNIIYKPTINNAEYQVLFSGKKLIVNGVTISTFNHTNNNTAELGLFCNYSNGELSAISNSSISYFIINENGINKANFVPCKHKVNGVEQCGMLDIVNVVWYGNANSSGSFTIPDISYTPSTP